MAWRVMIEKKHLDAAARERIIARRQGREPWCVKCGQRFCPADPGKAGCSPPARPAATAGHPHRKASSLTRRGRGVIHSRRLSRASSTALRHRLSQRIMQYSDRTQT
jgi:hypothetical protein